MSNEQGGVCAIEEGIIFVILVGLQVYQTLANLTAPQKSKQLNYNDVIYLLSKHCSPFVSEIYDRPVLKLINLQVKLVDKRRIVTMRINTKLL